MLFFVCSVIYIILGAVILGTLYPDATDAEAVRILVFWGVYVIRWILCTAIPWWVRTLIAICQGKL